MAQTTPYDTAQPFVEKKSTWLNEYDAARIDAYNLYDDLYRNSPDSMTFMLRSSDDKPIYVPTSKKLVNTFARYVLKGYGIEVVPAEDPATGLPLTASEQDLQLGMIQYGRLLKRERFLSRLASAKRQGLALGDWILFLSADPLKTEGSRISIRALDPRTYFVLQSPRDPEIVTGGMVVESLLTSDNKAYLRVLKFVRNNHPLHPNYNPLLTSADSTVPIARSLEYLEVDKWETEPKPFAMPATEDVLPAEPMTLLDGIFRLPFYHIKTNEEPGNPYGTSLVAGLENVIAGINQAWTDEDMSLAMAGLGMYATDSGSPIDDDGNEVPWQLGPSMVVEVGDGKKFERVTGVASVDPSQTHINGLDSVAEQTVGINDVATGKADPTVAESGVALAIRMGPLMDATDEIDTQAMEVLDQMWWDLRDWFKTYESIDLTNVTAISTTEEKLPVDREKRFTELKDMLLDGSITLQYFLDTMSKPPFNYTFPDGMINELMQQSPDEAAAGEEGGEEPPADDEGDDEEI